MTASDNVATELELATLCQRYGSVSLLAAISQNQLGRSFPTPVFGPERGAALPVFAAVAMADMALRFASPAGVASLTPNDFNHFVNRVSTYLLADPLTDAVVAEASTADEMLRMLVRIASTQLQLTTNPMVSISRSVAWFHSIPKRLAAGARVPPFNFADEYRSATGAEFLAVVASALVSFLVSKGAEPLLTRETFSKVAPNASAFTNHETLARALDRLCMGPTKARELHLQHQHPNRTLEMYDLRSAYLRPILRPFDTNGASPASEDRMIVPVPDVLPYRISDGVYFEMLGVYRTKFTGWFGSVFEEYVGDLIKDASPNDLVLSEDELRVTYPTSEGKVADWTIRRGDVAVIVECKASRFARGDLFGNTANDQIKGYRSVTGGLEQIADFRAAILNRKRGLEKLHGCKNLLAVVVSYDTMWMLNSNRNDDFLPSKVLFDGKLVQPTDFHWDVIPLAAFERIAMRSDPNGLCSVIEYVAANGWGVNESDSRPRPSTVHDRNFSELLTLLGFDDRPR